MEAQADSQVAALVALQVAQPEGRLAARATLASLAAERPAEVRLEAARAEHRDALRTRWW